MSEVPAPIENAIETAVTNYSPVRDQYKVTWKGSRFTIQVNSDRQRQTIAAFLQEEINEEVNGFNIYNRQVPVSDEEPVILEGMGSEQAN